LLDSLLQEIRKSLSKLVNIISNSNEEVPYSNFYI